MKVLPYLKSDVIAQTQGLLQVTLFLVDVLYIQVFEWSKTMLNPLKPPISRLPEGILDNMVGG